MAHRYLAATFELRAALFGGSWDNAPTATWCDAVIHALKEITGDALHSRKTKGSNFYIVTTGYKRITSFVRHSREDDTVCVGCEQGGEKKGYDSNVLDTIVQRAHISLTDEVWKMSADVEGGTKAIIPLTPLRPTSCPTALRDFAGDAYGSADEYLSFKKGDVVWPARAPSQIAPCGWAYGRLHDGTLGWYPPSFVS